MGASTWRGTLPEPEIANHWLVKFPRGRMTPEDQDVLRAEGVFYRALEQLDQNTICGAHVVEGKVPALWLPRFDREAIARRTVWPQDYQHSVYEPNYDKIIRDFAKDPDITRARFIAELKKLAGLRKKVVELCVPGRVLEHKNIVFDRPERFLETLKKQTGGDDA